MKESFRIVVCLCNVRRKGGPFTIAGFCGTSLEPRVIRTIFFIEIGLQAAQVVRNLETFLQGGRENCSHPIDGPIGTFQPIKSDLSLPPTFRPFVDGLLFGYASRWCE